ESKSQPGPGSIYRPDLDTWKSVSTQEAPMSREHHTAVWTGEEMIVWGGIISFNTGGRYCQAPNTAPIARCQNKTVSANPDNTADASIDNGSSDPDGDPLTLTQSPPGPYPVGMTSVMLTVTDGRGGSSMCSATVTITAFGPPPGDPAPGGKPPDNGSVLLYNYYTSGASPSSHNTGFALTNNHKSTGVFVHLFFVDGSSCVPADTFVCLAPKQTINFLASDLVPGETGYLWAIATDSNGVPSNHNFLSGRAEVTTATGIQAKLDAVAIAAIAAVPATADCTFGCIATLNFDGVHYGKVPRVLELDPVYSAADGNSTLLVVNNLSGNLYTGTPAIGALQGILTNKDTGTPYNFTNGAANCQFKSFLSDAFPLISPVFSAALPSKQEGNLKLWASTNIGLSGAVLRYNPKKKGKKFNSGDNLRAVTLTTAGLVIPVFPPAC
ncbi:MAG: hypothetical protein ABI882_22375, partial [Acidobacteriota bacterium]